MGIHPDIQAALALAGGLEPEKIRLAETAIQLSAVNRPHIQLEQYYNQVRTLGHDVLKSHKLLLQTQEDSASLRCVALSDALFQLHAYHAIAHEEMPQNIHDFDMINVMQNAKGNASMLSLLCASLAHHAGWDVHLLALPGTLLCRMDYEDDRVIFDPAARCRVLSAPDLRNIVKHYAGDSAELSATYYEPISKRDALVFVQNKVKYYQIAAEDYAAAADTIDALILMAPDEHRLWLDAGVVFAKVGRLREAADYLERYIETTPDRRARHEAAILLQQIRDT
jgi:regulator of sirC expression with transglutaminase-like and TPR domain